MKKTLVRVDTTPVFEKQLKKAPLVIKKALRERFLLFKNDQFHPLLHNHVLIGQYRGFRSINVTGDWRALYREIEIDDVRVAVEFCLFGTHSQLYKK